MIDRKTPSISRAFFVNFGGKLNLMPVIQLETTIKANINLCFDLSRSIDLHKISTAQSEEEAVAGRTSGLIELGETVTWKANHLGIRQQLTSIITKMDAPKHFRDEQLKGIFTHFIHDHYFEQKDDIVIMNDIFSYSSPLGLLGKIADHLFLENYMKRLLVERNKVIKDFAESDKWKKVPQLDLKIYDY